MPHLGLSEAVQSAAVAKLRELEQILAKEDVSVEDFVSDYAGSEEEEPMDASMDDDMADEGEGGEESGNEPKRALIIAMLKAKRNR